MTKAPGRSERKGVTLIQLMEMFPTDDAARVWFEAQIWPNGRRCPRCGCADTVDHGPNTKQPMRYTCMGCKKYFSVRIGTILEQSKVSFKQWAIAIYLHTTSLKGVSSMKLHRDIGVTQKTAWFMLQRIRQAWASGDLDAFAGPVEADETYVGGSEKNKHEHKKLKAGGGAVGKTAVAGVKDRATNKVKAKVVRNTRAATLQGFVVAATLASATVYTDDASAYGGIYRRHEAVKHSVGEYVRGQVHTNGMESFWAMLKRAHKGTFHKISPKHLQRYVAEFAGRHNVRPLDTVDQMAHLTRGMIGQRLTYKALIADHAPMGQISFQF